MKPRVSVYSSSSTEMSNDRLVTANHVAGRSWATTASMPVKKLTALWCSMSTPFGRPVLPDV
ncbi:unannotated protein [freshwater metagenome]|uniref:Unannotated protein n=1 Tax=freshwater metagenome TaxID=449393 RepID=A0A6J6EXM4_9ZZZZ